MRLQASGGHSTHVQGSHHSQARPAEHSRVRRGCTPVPAQATSSEAEQASHSWLHARVACAEVVRFVPKHVFCALGMQRLTLFSAGNRLVHHRCDDHTAAGRRDTLASPMASRNDSPSSVVSPTSNLSLLSPGVHSPMTPAGSPASTSSPLRGVRDRLRRRAEVRRSVPSGAAPPKVQSS